MATKRMRKRHDASNFAALFCVLALLCQGVTSENGGQEEENLQEITNRGDNDSEDKPGTSQTMIPEDKASTRSSLLVTEQYKTQKPWITPDQTDSDPIITDPISTDQTSTDRTNTPEKQSVTSKGKVVCVDSKPQQYRYDVVLKLKASSTCEESKSRIQSVLEHFCEDCKLEIYQQRDTREVIVYGDSIEADPDGMAEKFNNDNITDKVEVEEAVSRPGRRSKAVLISVLISGLLLAALLIAGYLLKTRRGQSKGLRLAEESFQVDQENQGNTLLSVAPLPKQELLDKPIINGESPDTPPTNGHSAPQTQVADTPM